VFIGTLETAPWPDGHFDAVVLYNTLEHLPSPKESLGRIGRLVRPGGLIGVQVPKADSLAFRLLRGRWRHAIPYHFYFFTASTMDRYFESAGFELADARTAPKVFTAGLLADRLWEWQWLPRRVGRPLAELVRRSRFSRTLLRINPRDDLLAHGRRRKPEPGSQEPPP
jgi:SAM-dependent methyltransferase